MMIDNNKNILSECIDTSEMDNITTEGSTEITVLKDSDCITYTNSDYTS